MGIGLGVIWARQGVVADISGLDGRSRSLRSAAWWLGLAVVYAVFLVGLFCYPFDVSLDPERAAVRLRRFFRIPFGSLYWGTELNAVSEVLRKVLLFAPLGMLGVMSVRALRLGHAGRRMAGAVLLVLGVGVAVLIEMIQVILPAHVSDITDVILCTLGIGLGVYIARQGLFDSNSEGNGSKREPNGR